ncbi:deoxynucleoside kinase-like [Bradysia coprophila]|uniref:deoxynucleoside kinase-like n=1 Tax=Bradysia coprophila TaxID=38358 RepID=UPI00187DCFB3|nr:deoxynucleoside kinase-like [Bradysia coprophila]
MARQVSDISCTSHRSNSLVVAVEGNIGAGKSSFLEYCSQHSELIFQSYPEPVDQWQSFFGTNVLSEYYGNPSKWAIPFQLLVGMTVGDNYRKQTWKRVKLIERSLLSSRYVFMENLLRNNVIEQGMADIMGTWYDRMLDDGDLKPHVIGGLTIKPVLYSESLIIVLLFSSVYLRTTPSVALSRIQARPRSAESSVTLGQLEDIHNLHEEWMEQVNLRNSAYDDPELPVFTIDADL